MARGQHAAKQKEWEAEIASVQAQLLEAEARDAYAASRPEGCFCLGLGGTGGGNSITGVRTLYGQTLWQRWCACPEGEEARRLALQALGRAEREEVEQRAARDRESALEDLRRRLERANIPPLFAGRTFDTFPDEPAKRAAIIALRELAARPDAGDGHGVFLWGECGVGKTGLAIATLRAWIEAGGSGLFVTVPELLDWLRPKAERGSLTTPEVALERLLTTPLLVLDDLGAERITDWARERLFLIVNHRHDHVKPTIYTSNYGLAETAHRLTGGERSQAGKRIVWRITETCHVIELQGRNLRAPAA